MDTLTLSTSSETRSLSVALGIALLCASLLTILAWTGYIALIKLAYPATVILIGAWLYAVQPSLYVSFTLWTWFVTPFVRRVVDYQVGFHDPTNPVMLAPLAVTALSLFTLFRFGNQLMQRRYFPILMAILGVLYGFLVGVVKVGVMGAIFSLLNWLLPLVFGFHVYLFWRQYPKYQRVITSTFIWGVLVMGTYALLQFVLAPVWDMTWLVQSEMTGSMGTPEAMEFRLFSTLNSTGPFAFVMLAGLLLLFSRATPLALLAAGPGYLSFLLSLVRSAWGGWVVGVIYLILRLEGTLRLRLIALMGAVLLLSLPLYTYLPNTDRIDNRMESITNLEGDVSYDQRAGLYLSVLPELLKNPIGEGLGGLGTAAKLGQDEEVVYFDSGILEIVISLGWVGSVLYLGGAFWLLGQSLRLTASATDQTVVVLVACALSFFTILLFTNMLQGLMGFVFWSLLCLALAGNAYYSEQSSSD